jgi:hypothetical protein
MEQCGLPSCSAAATDNCSACGTQGYCSKEHQRADWAAHKLVCKHLRKERKAKKKKKKSRRARSPKSSGSEGNSPPGSPGPPSVPSSPGSPGSQGTADSPNAPGGSPPPKLQSKQGSCVDGGDVTEGDVTEGGAAAPLVAKSRVEISKYMVDAQIYAEPTGRSDFEECTEEVKMGCKQRGHARKPDAAPPHEAAQAFVPGVDPGGAEEKEAGGNGKEAARVLDTSSRVPLDTKQQHAARKKEANRMTATRAVPSCPCTPGFPCRASCKRAFVISVVRVPTDEVSVCTSPHCAYVEVDVLAQRPTDPAPPRPSFRLIHSNRPSTGPQRQWCVQVARGVWRDVLYL